MKLILWNFEHYLKLVFYIITILEILDILCVDYNLQFVQNHIFENEIKPYYKEALHQIVQVQVPKWKVT